MEHLREIAIQKAKQSVSKYKISAIGLDKNGDIVCTAVNIPRFNRYGGSLHAEMSVLRRGGNRIATIVICRLNYNDTKVLPIEPCEVCQRVLTKKGIKVISIEG